MTSSSLPLETRQLHPLLGPVLAWALLLVVALWMRPPMPIDETRYLAVAWEMWQRGDLLVPYLLGEPYHHKPPLLFWGMHLGWWLMGVSEWWARLVAPLAALGALVATRVLARVLWPQERRVADLAPWLLTGMLFWSVFATLTMFDALIACCAVAGMLGLALAALRGRSAGWLLVAAALALGALAKGPVILLHLLPAALAAPWWAPLPRGSWWRWYACLAIAVAAGAGLALAWAIPAAKAGGETYGHAILWGQSAGRIAGGGELNAHSHPWWWLLPFVPALLFPWIVWPPVWRGLRCARGAMGEAGMRLCLVWAGCAFVAHSLISGKQVHYLVPLLPAAALIFGRVLLLVSTTRRDHLGVVAVLALVGAILVIGPLLDHQTLTRIGLGNREAAPQAWAQAIGWLPGTTLLAIAATLAVTGSMPAAVAVRRVTMAGIGLLLVLHLGVFPALRPAYDLEPIAQRIALWQSAGIRVARLGNYHGEFQFLGRLSSAPDRIQLWQVDAWRAEWPEGVLLMTYRPGMLPAGFLPPMERFQHRGRMLGIWQASAMFAATPP